MCPCSAARGELPVAPRAARGRQAGRRLRPPFLTHPKPPATVILSPITLCVSPLTATRHSRADRYLVQTLTERERETSDSPTSPLVPPPGTGQADPSWTQPNYFKARLRVCRRTGLPGDRNQSMGHKFNSTFPLPPAPCLAP